MRNMCRKLIKYAAALLMTIGSVGMAVLVYYGAQGYVMYKNAVGEVPVETMYAAVYSEREDFAESENLPEFYIQAVIAAEDRRFYSHSGVDPTAMARALWHDIKVKAPEQGGSTITQQLAKNFYYSGEKRLERKFAEMFTAFEIERKYTKDEIFEMYVNSIYFGSGHYGVTEAAASYFDKSLADLSDYECAMLAGIPNAPSAYSPDASPQLAAERTEQILKLVND
ncbi:MAG: transglycosylase domain-containing protein [Oscillospiraceae bacterium]|nr:transglycosylase domain-containing protein [Oscillospiraceae bacterium]